MNTDHTQIELYKLLKDTPDVAALNALLHVAAYYSTKLQMEHLVAPALVVILMNKERINVEGMTLQ